MVTNRSCFLCRLSPLTRSGEASQTHVPGPFSSGMSHGAQAEGFGVSRYVGTHDHLNRFVRLCPRPPPGDKRHFRPNSLRLSCRIGPIPAPFQAWSWSWRARSPLRGILHTLAPFGRLSRDPSPRQPLPSGPPAHRQIRPNSSALNASLQPVTTSGRVDALSSCPG